MKYMKYLSVLLILSLLLAGCAGAPGASPSPSATAPPITASPAPTSTPEATPGATTGAPSEELAAMLPDEQGYQWQYFGFAEYGHEMTLDAITPEGDIKYAVTGHVYDMSDGESDADFSIALTYTVGADTLIQEKTAPMMMDSAFDRLELLRTPLTQGAAWQQTVQDASGQDVTLMCTIEKVEEKGGAAVYTVLYQDTASDYYERREIRKGVGVIRFEKLYMPEGEEPFVIGCSLYTKADAVNAQLSPYLPVLGQDLYYFGLAEYGHVGKLTLSWENDLEAVYTFDGIFQDGSGIDAPFQVRYYVDFNRGTVTERVMSNGKRDENEINSKLHNIVILKLPIEEGATWSHQTTINGKEYTVRAEITEYDPDAGIIKVRYTAKDVPGYYKETYIEERTFERSYGMTAFQNLLPGDITVGPGQSEEQAIANYMFGYSLAKNMP